MDSTTIENFSELLIDQQVRYMVKRNLAKNYAEGLHMVREQQVMEDHVPMILLLETAKILKLRTSDPLESIISQLQTEIKKILDLTNLF